MFKLWSDELLSKYQGMAHHAEREATLGRRSWDLRDKGLGWHSFF